MSKGPVLFDLDTPTSPEAEMPNPAQAEPVPEVGPELPEGRAMQTVAVLAARKTSALAKWFWGLLASVIGSMISVAAWNFVTGLIAQNAILGMIVTALIAGFLLVCALIVLRELGAMARLSRMDKIQHQARTAIEAGDLPAARTVVKDVLRLYSGREDLRWGRDRMAERMHDAVDAADVLALAERELLSHLDAAAVREVEAAARQVATVTAMVPLALADVVAAMTSNLRMMRRVAEIYGGRGGFLGSWRLARAVMTHLVATGAVAVGDDMIEPLIGGGLLGKLSRRFGEGLVNGALTARVGIAAMEVCRPLPFVAEKRPSARGVVQRALAGFFKK
ncbi:TIGR01620 family protein [Donghicola sp. C2-DW-16]|uniref:TIGR01620 family protein n=1 Tax=Donghicola mangrovi TaxID=2729614 RepID=A0ABX2PFT9_9RHOB|nr:TIGR01620 family protein [Donghicola mangrovi]NVO28363.1 TIGR01620 family protein [Donghicola mangrovi]